jgi:hypothetical protein
MHHFEISVHTEKRKESMVIGQESIPKQEEEEKEGYILCE